MTEFHDLDEVILQEDLPSLGLSKGMAGTVIHVFTRPNVAYEVEFSGSDGMPIAQVPLTAEKLQKMGAHASVRHADDSTANNNKVSSV